jgi:hypothetical protein
MTKSNLKTKNEYFYAPKALILGAFSVLKALDMEQKSLVFGRLEEGRRYFFVNLS